VGLILFNPLCSKVFILRRLYCGRPGSPTPPLRIAEWQISLCTPVLFFKSGIFLDFFIIYIRYSTLLHLPPLRFHCVGGCWYGINQRLLRLWHWHPDAYSHSILDLIHCSYPSCIESILFHNPFSLSNSLPFHFCFLSIFYFLQYPYKKFFAYFTHLSVHSMLRLLFSCFFLLTFYISFCLFLPCTVYSLYSSYTSFRLYKKRWTHFVNFLQSSKFMFPTLLKSGIPNIRNVFIRIRRSVPLPYKYEIYVCPYF
jgi:hypothetical protein